MSQMTAERFAAMPKFKQDQYRAFVAANEQLRREQLAFQVIQIQPGDLMENASQSPARLFNLTRSTRKDH